MAPNQAQELFSTDCKKVCVVARFLALAMKMRSCYSSDS
jgi:hypothetical protein